MSSFTDTFGGGGIVPSGASYREIELSASVTLEWPLDNASGENLAADILDVTTNGAHTITMPYASLVSVGRTVLFNNLGPETLTVADALGNGLLSVAAGEAWLLYLYDNSSTRGLWRSFEMGATTAQAQPATLAGYGLIADGSTLAQELAVNTVSSTPYALNDTNRGEFFVWTGALGTMTLPAASSVGNGWFVHVRNGGTGTLTLDPASSETINDASTLALTPGDSAMIGTDGTEWYTVGLGRDAVFAFDYTVIDLDGLGPANYTLAGSELNRIVYKFTGVLAGDMVIIVPATAQQYWFENDTSGGSYTVSIKANGGATTIGVPRGERGIYYSDGSEVVKADTTAGISVPIDIADGGTGATSAATARTSLGAAASGANSDITSLTALSTPLSVAQGGTGSATAAGARTNLGSTVVGDAVFIAASAAAARSAMTAAASGTNTDITALNSTSGVTLGSPTTGSFPGTTGYINAKGFYVDGVAVGTSGATVTSVNASGGTTGLSFSGGPVTTSGTLTLAGTLGVANGGTGTTATPANGQVHIGNGTNLTLATLTAGAGISITNGAGSITIATSGGGSGTVTSVSGGSTGLTYTSATTTPTMEGTLALGYGGTGATTAAGARASLGAAASGANTDLTSISGLGLGTTSAPSIAPSAGTNTGFYFGATAVGVTLGGTQTAGFYTTRFESLQPVYLPNGSTSAPSVTFTSDTDTGFYRYGANQIGLTLGGTTRAVFDSSGFTITPAVEFSGNVTIGGDLQLSTPDTVPSTASSTGIKGVISYDSNYIYVCTATNTWKRAALSTW